MEDLSVRTTQSLMVGENLNTSDWVKKRIDYELELRDLNVELETVKKLIKEYFEDSTVNESSPIGKVLDELK